MGNNFRGIIGTKHVVMEPYGGLPCELMTFTINGMKADIDDFGCSFDSDWENAEPYCCGCHIFERCKTAQQMQLAMEKYDLTAKEYDDICEQLEDVLYVGSCGWCS